MDTNFTKKEFKFVVGVSSALGLRELGLMLILPFISLYGKTLSGSSPALIGLALGIYGLAMGCFQIPYGALSDRFGRKPIVLIGLFKLIIGMIVAYLARSIYVFILARALQGSGAINAAALSWVGDNVEKSRINKAMGVISATIGATIATALIGGSILQNFFTIPQIFLLCGILTIIIWIYIFAELRGDKDILLKRRQKKDLNTETGFNKATFFTKRLVDIYSMSFIMNISLMGMMFIIPQFLEKTIGPQGLWKVFIPATLAGIVSIRGAIRLSQKGKAKIIAPLSFFGLFISTIILFKPIDIIVSFGCIIFFAAFICLNAQMTSGVNLAADEQYRGAVQGVANTVQFIGAFLGGTLTGILWGINSFIAIGFIALICAAGIIISIRNSQIKLRRRTMKPLETGKIESELYAVRTKYVNMYIISSASHYICVDAGMNSNLVEKELERLGINADMVSHIFLTHTDYDHVGGINLFKNAKVFLSCDEEQMITGKTPRKFKVYFSKLSCNYKLLKDGDIDEYDGVTIKCISTPGHTPGSMSYLVNDKYLFSGDSVRLKEGEILPFFKTKNMDNEMDLETVNIIKQNSVNRMLCTAHTGIKLIN